MEKICRMRRKFSIGNNVIGLTYDNNPSAPNWYLEVRLFYARILIVPIDTIIEMN